MNRIRELCRDVNAEYKRKVTAAGATNVDLPQEIEEGNVEYKLQLLDPAPDRVKHLTTQLHWRLNEGNGEAFYEIGVRDNGEAVGIPLPSMIKSVRTLARMCQVLNAELEIVRFRMGRERALRALCVRVTRVVDKKVKQQLRVSVIGDFESGKSTLVGVLTRRGCLDDGCGLARMQVFRHRHEIENGCTSSISEHTIGVTSHGRFVSMDTVNDDCELRDEDDEFDDGNGGGNAASEIKSLITFSDLAGHQKYFKITASGLASQFPDYAMLVVDSAKGVQSMTKEHLKIALAFEVAVFVVLTKVDLVTPQRIAQTCVEIQELLASIAPHKTVRLWIDGSTAGVGRVEAETNVVPVLAISSVTGFGLTALQNYLAVLSPKRVWCSASATAPEFQINKAYDMDDTGTIVTGLVQSGTIRVGETMLLGPDSLGTFSEVCVDSIEVQRKAVPSLSAGETGALLISFPVAEGDQERGHNQNQDDSEDVLPPLMHASRIRKGMMLLHPSVHPMATRQFDAEVHLLATDGVQALKMNSQAVIHAGRVRQMAKVVSVEALGHAHGTHGSGGGDGGGGGPHDAHSSRAICRFEFMYWPEYMRPDIPVVLREACAYAVGKVVRAVHLTNGAEPVLSVRTF